MPDWVSQFLYPTTFHPPHPPLLIAFLHLARPVHPIYRAALLSPYLTYGMILRLRAPLSLLCFIRFPYENTMAVTKLHQLYHLYVEGFCFADENRLKDFYTVVSSLMAKHSIA